MAEENDGADAPKPTGDELTDAAADIASLIDFDLDGDDEQIDDQDDDSQDPEGDEDEGDEFDDSDDDDSEEDHSEEDDIDDDEEFEDDPEADDDDGDADDDSEAEPYDPDQVITITVDGKEEQATLGEAVSGLMRQKDYTRKTQQVAEERKAVQARSAELTDQQAQYADRLAFVEQFLALPEPDWAELKAKHTPAEYAAMRDQYDAQKKRLGIVQQEMETVRKDVATRLSKEREDRLETERQLFQAAVPEWLDAKVKAAETQAMLDLALDLGFTRETLENTDDHRILLILRDAARLRLREKAKDAAERRAAKGRRKSKSLPPGDPDRNTSKSTKRTTRRSAKARARLRKTGSVKDGAAAIFDLID